MAENSFTQFPSRISVNNSCPPRRYTPKKFYLPFIILFSSIFPPNFRPIRISTEEDQLKFELTTLALRKTYQHTYASTDSSEPRILHCPSCNFQTSGSLKVHQKHHEKIMVFSAPSAPTLSETGKI